MLVGGATRTPLVHRLLQERMGLEPRFEINPDLIVAMGASVQAGVIGGQKRAQHPGGHHAPYLQHHCYYFRERQGTSLSASQYPPEYPLPASKSEMVLTMFDDAG